MINLVRHSAAAAKTGWIFQRSIKKLISIQQGMFVIQSVRGLTEEEGVTSKFLQRKYFNFAFLSLFVRVPPLPAPSPRPAVKFLLTFRLINDVFFCKRLQGLCVYNRTLCRVAKMTFCRYNFFQKPYGNIKNYNLHVMISSTCFSCILATGALIKKYIKN